MSQVLRIRRIQSHYTQLVAVLAVWARISNVLLGHRPYARFPECVRSSTSKYMSLHWLGCMVQSTLRITIATLQLRVITIHSKCTVTNSLANLGQQAILRNEKSSARKSFLLKDCISEAVQSGCTSNTSLEDRNQNVEFLYHLTQYCWAIGRFQKDTSLVCPGESLGVSPRSTTQLQKETDLIHKTHVWKLDLSMTTPSAIARYSLIVGLSYHRAHLQLIYVGLPRTRVKVQLALEL